MAQKFKPLNLEKIEEGQFLEDADSEFRELQSKLIAFTRQYPDDADKSTAELTLKLKLVCHSAGDGLFSVKSSMSTKLPSRPAAVSMALATEDDDGAEVLFARESGADAGNPRQEKLCTRNGERTEAQL